MKALIPLLLLVLTGCSVTGALREPSPSWHTLTAARDFPADLPVRNAQVMVDNPSTAAGLDTVRIAVRPDPLTLDYVKGAEWVDPAPDLVQRLLVESFENTGRLPGVAGDQVGLRPDVILWPELRDFQAVFGGDGPVVEVSLGVKLLAIPSRRILGSHLCRQTAPANAGALPAIIEAWDQALNACLREVVVWTLRTGLARE